MNDSVHPEEAIFEAAFALPASERAAYLDRTCGGNAGLRQLVEALLEAHEEAGEFLEDPAPGAEPSPVAGPQTPRAGSETVSVSIEKPGDRIGRYKLLQQIGEGGCGVVYMAEQEEPVRRMVALKVIKLGMDTKQVIARFEAERQALALMDHPNIAKVLDAGATDAGRPYFVMELVRGIKVTDYCDQKNLPTRERLALFIQICQAIQHAHQKGIIHRDIKPSNILVTLRDGVPVPKVIDFGIAKATTDQRLTDKTLFTAFEQFIGTPAYMSPEQAEMSELGIDTRSDVYSLGVLLYELLTGQTPFDGKELLQGGLDAMRRIIREKEPARPSTRLSTLLEVELTSVANHRQTDAPKLVHLLRGDLDWIVMKALEKDRARRYETANGLAVDVQRHLADEPVVARPPSRLYEFQKTVRRHKGGFAAASAVVGALFLGVIVSTREAVRATQAEKQQSRLREAAQRAQTEEAEQHRQAVVQELASRRKAYASDMNLVQQALAANNFGRARDLLNRQRPQPGLQDLRGWEWRYLWQFCQSDAAFRLCQLHKVICAVSFSSDGALLAVGTDSGEVTVWDIATRQMIFRDDLADGPSRKLAFAPRGELLAFCDRSGIVLWNSHTRAEVRHLPTGGRVRDLAFASDGRLFAAILGQPSGVALWDVATGGCLTNLVADVCGIGVGTVFQVAPEGNRFAHAALGHIVRVVDAAPGGSQWSVQATEELTTALAFSGDGRFLATGSGYTESAIKLWDMQTHELIGPLEGHRSWVGCLKFLPDGKTLASASADQTIRLWEVETRQPLRILHGHGGEVHAIAVSPDGRMLASGCADGSVLFWNLGSSSPRPPEYRTLDAGKGFVAAWAGSPDGHLIGVVQDGRAKLYDALTLQFASEPAFPMTNINHIAFSPDGRLLVGTATNGQLAVWALPGQVLVTNIAAHAGEAHLVDSGFLSGGKSLWTWGGDHLVREWDVVTWQEIGHWQVDTNIYDAQMRSSSLCPAKGLAAIAGYNGTVELITASDPGRRRRFTGGQDDVAGIALSPDGKTLATASERGTLELWNTDTGKSTALLRGVLLGLHSAAISPDNRRVAAGSNGLEAIKIWDLESHEEVATLAGKGSLFLTTAFSPDGNTIGARNYNGVLHLWHAPSWAEIDAAEQAQKAAQ